MGRFILAGHCPGPSRRGVILRAMAVTDAHIHVQPWWNMKPDVLERITHGRDDLDELRKIMKSPAHLLRRMDADGIAGRSQGISPWAHSCTGACSYRRRAPRRLAPAAALPRLSSAFRPVDRAEC